MRAEVSAFPPLPNPSPAGGEGLCRPVCGWWFAPVGGMWTRGLGARVCGRFGGWGKGCFRLGAVARVGEAVSR